MYEWFHDCRLTGSGQVVDRHRTHTHTCSLWGTKCFDVKTTLTGPAVLSLAPCSEPHWNKNVLLWSSLYTLHSLSLQSKSRHAGSSRFQDLFGSVTKFYLTRYGPIMMYWLTTPDSSHLRALPWQVIWSIKFPSHSMATTRPGTAKELILQTVTLTDNILAIKLCNPFNQTFIPFCLHWWCWLWVFGENQWTSNLVEQMIKA